MRLRRRMKASRPGLSAMPAPGSPSGRWRSRLWRPRAARISIVRDVETEQLLRDYALPVLKAAGINAAHQDHPGQRPLQCLRGERPEDLPQCRRAHGRRDRMRSSALSPMSRVHIAGGHLAIPAAGGECAGSLRHRHAGRRRRHGGRGRGRRPGRWCGHRRDGARHGEPGTRQRNLLAYQRSEEQAADRRRFAIWRRPGSRRRACSTPSRASTSPGSSAPAPWTRIC